jgi:hypothetical protein
MPVTCDRVIPCAMTLMPPALVATVPPMVAESRACQVDAVLPPLMRDVSMEIAQRDARAHGDLTAHIVDGIQAREATGGQDHGWTPRPGDHRGDGSADKPGVAALGHDRDPGR